MVFYGYYVLVLLGMTFQKKGTHHIKHVIKDFSNGFVLVYLNRFFIDWQQIYVNVAGLIYLNVT
jgi:hypothetical protein